MSLSPRGAEAQCSGGVAEGDGVVAWQSTGGRGGPAAAGSWLRRVTDSNTDKTNSSLD